MNVRRGKMYVDDHVSLDNTAFIGCFFERCVLEYSGEPVSFDSSVFRACKYVFYGKARSTVHFLQAVELINSDPGLWGEFPETEETTKDTTPPTVH